MPRLDEHTEEVLRDAESGIRRRTASAWDSFSNFALRDNVLEVAVGLILAASFTACANSLVSDIILPLISLLPFLARNLDEKFAILKHGPNYNGTIANGYNTVGQALADGAVVFAYGSFLDKVVRFLAVAVVLWGVAMGYSRGTEDSEFFKFSRCCRRGPGLKGWRGKYTVWDLTWEVIANDVL
ncbi:hypothetical protein IQ07DRAFT_387838 [Pyrenochaeta sp. DS3sAY3a]|nr:hypothetical protein IQ07DRAFT_387838 [Pyrenochaeta sp. DS3sAY3a]